MINVPVLTYIYKYRARILHVNSLRVKSCFIFIYSDTTVSNYLCYKRSRFVKVRDKLLCTDRGVESVLNGMVPKRLNLNFSGVSYKCGDRTKIHSFFGSEGRVFLSRKLVPIFEYSI